MTIYFLQGTSTIRLVASIVKNENRPLLIFPQGTRVLPNDRPPFKKGVSRIYEELKIIWQPVAINSGHAWPKQGHKKANQTISISILKPIKKDFTKDKFIKVLENSIYTELDRLN